MDSNLTFFAVRMVRSLHLPFCPCPFGVFCLVTILFLIPMGLQAQPPENQYPYPTRSMETRSDIRRPDGFSELVMRSGREHKLLLLAICADNHPPSQRLRAETLNNPQLAYFLDRGFLFYQARTGDYYSQDHYLARRYSVQTYPSLLLVNAREEAIWQYQGFISAQELMYLLARYLPGSQAPPSFNHKPVAPGEVQPVPMREQLPAASVSDNFVITDNIETGEPAALPSFASETPPPPVPAVSPAIQSTYGLVIQTDKDAEEIRQSARRWKLVWAGDIWMQEMENGTHRLILGSLTTEKAARNKRLDLRKRNGIHAKMLQFSPQDPTLTLHRY